MKLNELFDINYGQREYHSKENLDKGDTLLISSQGVDNGCYSFFNVPVKFQPNFVTVPSTGSIGMAFVQTHPCCVDDNCLVLIPKKEMPIEYLYYVSSKIRNQKWRYRYGRQITPTKLGELEIIDVNDFNVQINYNEMVKELTPEKKEIIDIDYNTNKKEFLLSELFDIQTGDFHSINELEKGNTPLISCSDVDNGIVGFYDIPNEKTHKNKITVAYDGKPLTAKYHPYKFTAYDNVGILIPKTKLRKTTLLFVTLILNIERWRYSYGRKCYKNKLDKTTIKLPVNKNNELDEDYIEEIMEKRDLFGVLAHHPQ